MPEEGGTSETLEGEVPPLNSNANYNKNVEDGGTEATLEAAVPPYSSNENENPEEGAGWTDIKRAVLP